MVVIGRDPTKGARAAAEFSRASGNLRVQFLKADLGLVEEANRAANEAARQFASLEYLVHSAGIVRGWRELTAEGIESNFAINYLSRFVLRRRLLPNLAAAGRPGEAARIVVIRGAARHGRLHFPDINLTSNFATLRAVLQFCHANDVFTVEMARRLEAGGIGQRVTVTCLKIGVVKTSIRREFPRWMKLVVPLLFDPLMARSREEAADSALRLLLAPEFEGISGALFSNIRRFKRVCPTARALGRQEGRQLWQLSERQAPTAPVSAGPVEEGLAAKRANAT